LFDAAPQEFGSSRTFIATVALAVGLLTGFAGGYVASARNQAARLPTPSHTPQEGGSLGQPAPEQPAQTYTETPVKDGSAEVPVPALASAEVSPVRTTEVVSAAPRAVRPVRRPSAGTGAIVVFSRPSGAEVFLDEQRVGSTPLSLARVAAGTHGVRIALPEHRAWSTSVRVTPGSSLRVAASLER
jgi:PEGA domain